MATVEQVAIEGAKFVFGGTLGFGIGCLVGKLMKGPILLTGGVYSINIIATNGLDLLVKSLANKYEWKLSTVKYLTALTGILTTSALAVSLLAIGILSPAGMGLMIGIGSVFAAIPLGIGLYAQYGGKDMSYGLAKKQTGTFYQIAV